MRIGALIPVWNQERFIKPHIEMLQRGGVEKIVVLFEPEALGSYQREYDIGIKKDRTEEIVKSLPGVEWHEASYRGEFMCGLFNEGIPYVKDCDMVFKLDPDCFFTDRDFSRLIQTMRKEPFDCYRLNCKTNSINYYVPERFDLGIRNGGEPQEVYAFNPNKDLHGVTSYDASKPCLIGPDWGDFTMHHFKGWKKKFTSEWAAQHEEFKRYPLEQAPLEIIKMLTCV